MRHLCEAVASCIHPAAAFTVLHDTRLATNETEEDSLGMVRGDDHHCRAVCALLPGCNMIVRPEPGPACFLYTACADRSHSSQCTRQSGRLIMLRNRCSRPSRWHKLKYRLPIEGEHLGVVEASGAHECARLCDQTPGCNSFARFVLQFPYVFAHHFLMLCVLHTYH